MKDYKTIENMTLEECEDYLKDSNLNQAERLYAEQHREEMMKWPWKKSVMEEFPEYGFRPTSLTKDVNWRNRFTFLGWGVSIASLIAMVVLVTIFWGDEESVVIVIGICVGILIISLLLTFILSCFDIKKKFVKTTIVSGYTVIVTGLICLGWVVLNDDDFFLIGLLLCLVGLLVLLPIGYAAKKTQSIKTITDYISTQKNGRQRRYLIFVKDRKFGVLNSDLNSVVILPEYDKLSWAGKIILEAKRNGSRYLINIYGNRLS